MNKGTFGSVKQYKMLDFLTEKVSLMDEKNKNYISSVISDINSTVKKSELIEDIQFRNYLLSLIFSDFKNRINEHISNKYEEKVVTYLENYLYAKIKNSKQK
jgi:hypothetical protein